jgi:NTE family protein
MKSNEPKIAVVLGGGGIKPFAAVPLFAFLKENHIPVNFLVGCSGGSIMAAFYASGYSPEQMMKELMPRLKKSMFRPNIRALLAMAKMPYGRMDRESAFFRKESIFRLIREVYGNRMIEDLETQLILQATDFQTGEGIGLDSGDLATAVYASSAIFPFFPPVQVGDRWLFDGVFSAPIPVMQAVRKNADIIIVVDFLEKLSGDPKGPLDSMMHLSKMYAKTIMSNQMALSIDLHTAEIVYFKVRFERYVSLWETERFPEILDAGQKVLDRMKPELLSIIGQYKK